MFSTGNEANTNDIEMILQAFVDNKMQYYTHTKKHSISKAIRSPWIEYIYYNDRDAELGGYNFRVDSKKKTWYKETYLFET